MTSWDPNTATALLQDMIRKDRIRSGNAEGCDRILQAIDKLEGYRVKMEALIEMGEKDELESLRLRYPENENLEYWEYFYPVHWRHIFLPQFRYSFLVSALSLVEYQLDQVCSDASDTTDGEIDWATKKNSRGNLLNLSWHFLKTKPFHQLHLKKEQWDRLKNLYELRNVVAHNGGTIWGLQENRSQKLQNIADTIDGINIDDNGIISIDMEFCRNITKEIQEFFHALCDELAIWYKAQPFDSPNLTH